MSHDGYEWDPRPPNMAERIGAGLYLAVFLLLGASSYAGWRLVGGCEKQVMTGMAVAVLALLRFLPTAKRL